MLRTALPHLSDCTCCLKNLKTCHQADRVQPRLSLRSANDRSNSVICTSCWMSLNGVSGMLKRQLGVYVGLGMAEGKQDTEQAAPQC